MLDTTHTSIFSREEARLMLDSLPPGSEEHDKMQNMLFRGTGIVQATFKNVTYKFDVTDRSMQLRGGGCPSHNLLVSERVNLHQIDGDEPLLVIPRHSGRVVELQFKHVVALAADFYGLLDTSIFRCTNNQETNESRFERAFDALAQGAEGNRLLDVVKEIEKEVTTIGRSGIPRHSYSSRQTDTSRKLRKIGENIDRLFINNSDQFSEDAREVYRMGHALAIGAAKEAGAQQDLEGLKHAYALDAFACHFLVNLFAAGHIRNQRGALEEFLLKSFDLSADLAQPLAGLLTAVQHQKDGRHGLNLYNREGARWKAYGEEHSLIVPNQTVAAIQQSVDEVYKAYDPAFDGESDRINWLIPHVDPLNPPPFYRVSDEGLFIHQLRGEKKIENLEEYLLYVAPEVIEYLPEGYLEDFVHHFLTPHDPKIPKILKSGGVILGEKAQSIQNQLRASLSIGVSGSKECNGVILQEGGFISDQLVAPRVEKLTSPIWDIVALDEEQGNERQMAHAIEKVRGDSRQILHKIDAVGDAGKCQSYLKQIETSIGAIQSKLNQAGSSEEEAPLDQLKRVEKELKTAYTELGTLLCGCFPNGKHLLEAHNQLFKMKRKSPDLLKLEASEWLRELIDYQVELFSLYHLLQLSGSDKTSKIEKIQELFNALPSLERSIAQQLLASRSYINEILLFGSRGYRDLERQKIKVSEEFAKKI